MRLLVTADLHHNHPRSRAGAEQLARHLCRRGGDALLLVGDTAAADASALEESLSHFDAFAGPRLLVPGNHDLWSKHSDAVQLLEHDLPRRAAALGWHWLPGSPRTIGPACIVGTLGWYDYSFEVADLGVPQAFYHAKSSPGAVLMSGEPADLVPTAQGLPASARKIVARWNDRRFVRLPMTDAELVDRLLEQLEQDLGRCGGAERLIVASHTVPFAGLLPPRHGGQFDFARAYLGSSRIGELIRRFANVTDVLCGHSHVPAQASIGLIRAINIGSGYRSKRWVEIDLDDPAACPVAHTLEESGP